MKRSELQQIIKEELQKLTEAKTVTMTDEMNGYPVDIVFVEDGILLNGHQWSNDKSSIFLTSVQQKQLKKYLK